MSDENRRDRLITPCRQVCRMGVDGLCDGCGRTMDEIARWLNLAPRKRSAVMRRVLHWEPRL